MNEYEVYWVYMTVGSVEEARAIGSALVKARLAACANLLPGMESIYHWEGEIQRDREVILIAKTTGARLADMKTTVRELHSYDCPCILVLPVVDGNQPFINWIGDQVA